MSRGRHYAEVIAAVLLWVVSLVTVWLSHRVPRVREARRERRRLAAIRRAYELEAAADTHWWV
jgi:hypothetical protein